MSICVIIYFVGIYYVLINQGLSAIEKIMDDALGQYHVVARKAKVIQKIAKKLLRGLKAGESERIRKNKLAQADAVGD